MKDFKTTPFCSKFSWHKGISLTIINTFSTHSLEVSPALHYDCQSKFFSCIMKSL